MQEFQRFCGVMFGATRNPMLRCGVATRRKTVDSCRPGTAMLDSEPFVKLLRTLVVSVSMCMAIHVFSGCQHFGHMVVRRLCLRVYLVRSSRTVARCELVQGFHMGVIHHILHT